METVWNLLNQFHIPSTIHATLLIIIGYFLAKFVSHLITQQAEKKISKHSAMLLNRGIFYFLFILFIISAVQQLGFHIGTLLGAAGILTAAIGFASQTSMSNVISGIFIIGEKPFEIGDTIKVNDIQGQVATIDLLSVKIRTNDNTMIRVPNETLVKSPIINLSFFPWRRADLKISINSDEDISRVRKILFATAKKNQLCLDEPEPTLQIQNLDNSSVELQFSVWANQANFSEAKSSILEDIQSEFTKEGVMVSVPTRIVASITDSKT